MKITVIGAGAMGILYGGWLSAENEVSFIDSQRATVDAINNKGIKIQYDNEERVYKNVKAFFSGECMNEADLVIVFVKSNYTRKALEENKRIIGDNTVVITLQNGLGNDSIIEEYASEKRLVVGICRHNALKLSPWEIRYTGGRYTAVGSKCGNTELAEKVGAVFNSSKIYTVMDDEIMRSVWSKLFVNATMNPLTAIFNVTNGFIIDNPHAWSLSKSILKEALMVAEAEGIKFEMTEAEESVRFSCEIAYEGYTSMYQDMKKKVKTEIDYINGAIVRLGEKYGIETPCNRYITEVIHGLEGATDYKKI